MWGWLFLTLGIALTRVISTRASAWVIFALNYHSHVPAKLNEKILGNLLFQILGLLSFFTYTLICNASMFVFMSAICIRMQDGLVEMGEGQGDI